MIKNYFFLLVCIFTKLALTGQNINFKDNNFKKALTQNHNPVIDTDRNGEISHDEAKKIKTININNKNVSSLEGIEFFTELEILECGNNKISRVNLEKNINLINANFGNNILSRFEIFNNKKIKILNLSRNILTRLDISENKELIKLSIDKNKIGYINIDSNTKLKSLHIGGNSISELNISNNKELVHFSSFKNNFGPLDFSKNSKIEEITLKHSKFRKLDLSNNPNLKILRIDNNSLKEINLSKNNKLIYLDVGSNKLENLDLSKNYVLRILDIGQNKLNSLNLSNNNQLKEINIESNHLKNIDLSKNKQIFKITILNNELATLNLSNNTNLKELSIVGNKLEQLNLSNNKNLNALNLVRVPLNNLDLSKCTIKNLYIYRCNNLTTLNLTNQPLSNSLEVYKNPKLSTVCSNPNKIDFIEEKITGMQNGNANLEISSSCATSTHNVINSVITYAQSADNCRNSRTPFPYLHFNLTNNKGYKSYIANTEGKYNKLVKEGEYNLKPYLNEKQYFNIAPNVNQAESKINFRGKGEIFTRNICVVPNGKHKDLAISIVGDKIIPGKESTYTIILENKGTLTLSGNFNFKYDDSAQKFISSSMEVGHKKGMIFRRFLNLHPMEIMRLKINFKINKNLNKKSLSYVAKVSEEYGEDEDKSDNTSIFNHKIEQSWNPNTIFCQEGEIMEPNKTNDYLNFLIHFKNTENKTSTKVVIENTIDQNIFNINSFIPIQGSHPFTTEIINNKVIFTFKKIKLPKNGEGYVFYKIKTSSKLKAGDIINNKAIINFDNKAIETNKETVVINQQSSDIEKPKFHYFYTLKPNVSSPTMKLIPTKRSNEIHIKYFTVYDLNGRFIKFSSGKKREFNFSRLRNNNVYILNMHTKEHGILAIKFSIKEQF